MPSRASGRQGHWCKLIGWLHASHTSSHAQSCFGACVHLATLPSRLSSVRAAGPLCRYASGDPCRYASKSCRRTLDGVLLNRQALGVCLLLRKVLARCIACRVVEVVVAAARVHASSAQQQAWPNAAGSQEPVTCQWQCQHAIACMQHCNCPSDQRRPSTSCPHTQRQHPHCKINLACTMLHRLQLARLTASAYPSRSSTDMRDVLFGESQASVTRMTGRPYNKALPKGSTFCA